MIGLKSKKEELAESSVEPSIINKSTISFNIHEIIENNWESHNDKRASDWLIEKGMSSQNNL